MSSTTRDLPAPGASDPTAPAVPRLQRRRPAILGGVAHGVAEHFDAPVMAVRLVFVLACLLNGAGAGVYLLLWMLTPVATPVGGVGEVGEAGRAGRERERERGARGRIPRAWLSWALVPVGILATGLALGVGLYLIVPLSVAALGALGAWLAYDRLHAGRQFVLVLAGIVVVLLGVVWAVVQWNDGGYVLSAVVPVLITVLGIMAVALPILRSEWDRRSTLRAEQAAAEERTRIALALHDSVLQTLALISKRSGDPEVVRLARRQERELRQWLFTPRQEASLFAAVEAVCGQVEDTYPMSIDPVLVGEDRPADTTTLAAIDAAREAMVNAAKHSGQPTCDVYVESAEELRIYVRDRGPGFDLDAIPPDRHGVRDSIIGRVTAVGGTAEFTRRRGTEVCITVPLNSTVPALDSTAPRLHRPRPGGPPVTTRVFLVDDHSVFRAGVRAEISHAVTICGEASTVAEAITGIRATRPEVVLLDVHMPDGGGVAVITEILHHPTTDPAPRFLALSVSDAAEDVIAVIRAGARGYVTKSINAPELIDAITRVRDNDAVFSPRLAGFVLDAFTRAESTHPTSATSPASPTSLADAAPAAPTGRHPDTSPSAQPTADSAAPTAADSLTRRELEVLRLLARGYTYREIAEDLFISIKTVETHASNILRKTQQSNRHALTRWAQDHRLA